MPIIFPVSFLFDFNVSAIRAVGEKETPTAA
jgi:hypothetical protein